MSKHRPTCPWQDSMNCMCMYPLSSNAVFKKMIRQQFTPTDLTGYARIINEYERSAAAFNEQLRSARDEYRKSKDMLRKFRQLNGYEDTDGAS